VAETRATIPDRGLFKAAEVCEIAGVQPYVLRSWELEFPSIGTAKSPGSARVYRKADVERILRIKDLVFTEGLTLAGARRRLEEEETPAEAAFEREAADPAAKAKIGQIKDGLRALLNMLDGSPARKAGAWPPSAQPGVLEFDGASAGAALAGEAPKKPNRKKPARS
jgi:DNA-binding transcriptional MerR regulator